MSHGRLARHLLLSGRMSSAAPYAGQAVGRGLWLAGGASQRSLAPGVRLLLLRHASSSSSSQPDRPPPLRPPAAAAGLRPARGPRPRSVAAPTTADKISRASVAKDAPPIQDDRPPALPTDSYSKGHAAASDSRPRLPRVEAIIRHIFLTLGCALGGSFIAIAFWEHVASLLWVTGGSMHPTLNPDFYPATSGEAGNQTSRDVLLVRRWRPAHDLRRGMVVTFRSPHDPRKVLAKRIIALPGDEVRTHAPCPKPTQLVDWNHVWVEGDSAAWRESRDSNWFGPLSMSLITGQAVAVLGRNSRWLRWEDWEAAGEEEVAGRDALTAVAAAQKQRVRRDAVQVVEPDQW